MGYILIILEIIHFFLPIASFLVGRLVTDVVQALNNSIADDTLNALIAQGDRQILKYADILDLFACQNMAFGQPFGIFNKPDLLKPLLF
eukprot:12561248-Ditylum_brightwellii.AAC.1